jgi:hypothetical protein
MADAEAPVPPAVSAPPAREKKRKSTDSASEPSKRRDNRFSKPEDYVRCAAMKADGTRCKKHRIAGEGSEYCERHTKKITSRPDHIKLTFEGLAEIMAQIELARVDMLTLNAKVDLIMSNLKIKIKKDSLPQYSPDQIRRNKIYWQKYQSGSAPASASIAKVSAGAIDDSQSEPDVRVKREDVTACIKRELHEVTQLKISSVNQLNHCISRCALLRPRRNPRSPRSPRSASARSPCSASERAFGNGLQ